MCEAHKYSEVALSAQILTDDEFQHVGATLSGILLFGERKWIENSVIIKISTIFGQYDLGETFVKRPHLYIGKEFSSDS